MDQLFPVDDTTMADAIRELVGDRPFVPFTICLRSRTRIRIERPEQVSFRGRLVVCNLDGLETLFPSISVVSLEVEGPWKIPAPDAVVGPKDGE